MIKPIAGKTYTYQVTGWYPDTEADKRNLKEVTWELFKQRKNGKFTSTRIRKKGISDFTFGEKAIGSVYRLEAYLYGPEGGGLIIRPQPGKTPKILKVDLLYTDGRKGSTFSFMEKLTAKAYCTNLLTKELTFTLWEDDAKGPGHHTANKPIETKTAEVNINGTATVEFVLTKALMRKAMQGEPDPKELEFYVTAEYYVHKKHATGNVEIKNPFPPLPHEIRPKPTDIPKAKNSPAASKPTSAKEDKGIGDIITDKTKELWDWWETKGTIKKEQPPTRQKPDGRSPAMVKEQQINNTCFCKKANLYWGKYFNCQERKRIIEIAYRLGSKPDYLTSAMALETGGTFDPKLINSKGYTGLIQIGKDAAADINRRKKTNITSGKNGNLKNMTKFEQLIYVEYYLEPYKGKLNTLADFYLAILMPVDCGKGNQRNHVVFDKNLILDYNAKGEVIKNTKWVRKNGYSANPVFHKEENEEGKTYVWEIAKEIEKWYNKGELNKESTFSCQQIAADKKDVESNTKWHDPVDNPEIALFNFYGSYNPTGSSFGLVRNAGTKNHQGLDIFAPKGTPVKACLDGKVVLISENAGSFGKFIVIEVNKNDLDNAKIDYNLQYKGEKEKGPLFGDTNKRFLRYGHLSEISVLNNQRVTAGMEIGKSGNSGNAAKQSVKARHLHFEITDAETAGDGLRNRQNPAFYVRLKTPDRKTQENNKY
ncbi:M23 family metallopeptidase [uncultured Chryseobacterium sp.]|uniref:M23 family metallopeptidase n=1 Tax=uncultured Chryseobacterium sp. TaxID=259322 RepID=UPI0025D37046|nr:M23 family metallopeptidase [uncultured Chryseobacterium sp.]